MTLGAFGKSVRAHRRRLSLTQEDLAEQTGLSVRTIGKIETGRIAAPRPPTVRLLADALRLTGDDRDRFCQAIVEVAEDGPSFFGIVPAQLPRDAFGFTGREHELAVLDGLLTRATEQSPWTVTISAISGTAGVGKTALAVRWAHRVAHRFPDGQLYVNLRGFDPAARVMTPSEAVCGFLYALGVPPGRIPVSFDAQAALYRTLLAGKRILILLDNARDAEQARPLLPAGPDALALITSRNQLTGLVAADGALPLSLNTMSDEEARVLLIRRLGGRVAAEPEAAHQIITACARLPLALCIAAARANQSLFPLAVLATELSHPGRKLDALDAGDPNTDVRAVFSSSYDALSAPAARMFRLLGLHPGPDISTAAAASLAGNRPPQVRELLTELTRAHLVTEYVPGRYTFHDLLRAYASNLAHAHEAEPSRHAALTRLLDYYTHTALAAAELVHPDRDPICLPFTHSADGTAGEVLLDQQRSVAWLDLERPCLLAAVEMAAAASFEVHTFQLAWALDRFLHARGAWKDLAMTWQIAFQAADRIGDSSALAEAHLGLAHVEVLNSRHANAGEHLQHALHLFIKIGDRAGEARTLANLAYHAGKKGEPELAASYARSALGIYQNSGDRGGQAWSLNQLGAAYALMGDHRSAMQACEQAIELYQQAGHPRQAYSWDSLGNSHHHLGNHLRAIECYREALARYPGDLSTGPPEAATLTRLGETHRATGDLTAARAAWTEAVRILTDLNHPDAHAVRSKLDALNDSVAKG